MQTISFMTANFVARQLGYRMTEGWMQGDRATQDHFRNADTFGTRFEAYLRDIQAMGYEAIDLWLAILHPSWATDVHIETARQLLERYHLPVVSLAGDFGASREAFTATCSLATRLGCALLGGMTGLLENDRAFVVSKLRDSGLRLGMENHAQKTPEAMLAQIGEDEDVVGTTVDTGWYGTQGYDAAEAVRKLGHRLFHIHLKDVRQPGGHETCRFGEGCVPVENCVRALKQLGYTGPISVEHEPDQFDPTDDLIANLQLLKEWMSS